MDASAQVINQIRQAYLKPGPLDAYGANPIRPQAVSLEAKDVFHTAAHRALERVNLFLEIRQGMVAIAFLMYHIFDFAIAQQFVDLCAFVGAVSAYRD